ncbi:MAG: branched-chain amino acid ABC transporter permease [Bacillota bacterium]
MAEVLQQTVNGVVVGASYALIASGLTVIFGLMRIVNFAHGEFYMIGAVFMYYLAMSIGLNFFAAIFLSAVLTMVLGIIVDRLVLKPLRNAPMTSTTLATIGLSVLLQNLVLVTSGAMPKMINSPFAQAPLEIGSIIISSNRLFAAAVTLIVIVLADWALNHTSFGRDIRACFQDQDAAALVGISVNKVYAATFTVGAGMAALAGSLLGSIFLVYPTMGETAVSKAFTVVIVGGLGNFRGAVVVGLLLGVIEALAAGYVSAGYKDAIGFILIVCFLLYQPLSDAWRVRKVRTE